MHNFFLHKNILIFRRFFNSANRFVEYHYTSGRVETRNEGNPANIAILGIKFGLMIAGVLIFCFVSVLIMTIETISGLKRNFNWAAMLNKGKKAPVAVAEAPINARND